jgi:hypothetical protein
MKNNNASNLQQLMTIETKYNIDDRVWFMYNNKPNVGDINGVRICRSNNLCDWGNKIEYCVQIVGQQQVTVLPIALFKTKEDLLASL